MKTRSLIGSVVRRLSPAIFLLACAGALVAQDNFTYSRTAVINDPDDYTNIRKEGAKKSPVIGKVKKGEKFEVAVTSGMWWPVKTSTGLTGFIDSNRVTLLERIDDPSIPAKPGADAAKEATPAEKK